MFRCSSYSRAFAVALIFVALSAVEAMAHCFVGARFLPATLATDDPCVADEISLPTVSWSKTADMPAATESDVSVDLAKRITEDFGISIGQGWTQIHQPGGFTAAGFGNLETTAQYQLLKDGPHELALLLGLIVEWGGTGAVNSGLAAPFSTLTPTFYFGKGLGDLPDSFGWLRAFAVTGQIGYQIPTRSFDIVQNSPIPQVLVYGGSIQFSMPYLKSEIRDYQLPDFINHLIPIVEVQLATPVTNNYGNSALTTGTVNPGVIWVGSYFQVGLEAVFPVNAESGHAIGVLGQLHLYLDDIFPNSIIGRPLLGGSSTPPQQLKF
ncbi:MAG: hypothetical protein WBD11_13680 [Xanthobacteraceae bacterium]|jgi:hypothetical protein